MRRGNAAGETTMIYAVEMTDNSGTTCISRYFQTKRGARHWVKWLRKQRFVASARIMMGGPGGMEIE